MVSSPSSSLWPLSMEVATECRMQNVECSLVPSSMSSTSSSSISGSLALVFTTTRPVEKGQRLYFWFSEAMLAQLEMPFLVPKNIQGTFTLQTDTYKDLNYTNVNTKGGDRYVCHRCTSVFTTPNPLKIHLFFHCAQRSFSLPSLWSRVHHVLTSKTHHQSPLFANNKAHQHAAVPALISAIPHHHHLSAFRPATSPAQVETLVSHLGRSKHGHVCIYCGKVYSRKYGLKIHIR